MIYCNGELFYGRHGLRTWLQKLASFLKHKSRTFAPVITHDFIISARLVYQISF